MTYSEKTTELISALFGFMWGLFPSTCVTHKSSYDVNHAKDTWAYAFELVGIIDSSGKVDEEVFLRGFRLLPLLNQRCMPSCGQFIALCLNGLHNNDVNGKGMQKDNI